MIAYKYNNKKRKEHMGIMKEKYIENQIKKEHGIFDVYVDKIAEKVANEPIGDILEKWMVGETEDGHMPLVEKPQHVIDEDRADEIRQMRKEQAQMEMFDDPYLNWSGLR
jgi:hypothetical protein